MRRGLLLFLIAASLGTAFVGSAQADARTGMPLDSSHLLADPDGVDDPLVALADAKGRKRSIYTFAAHSRLEAEGKAAVEDAKQFELMKAAIARLAEDPKLAAKVLGPGWFLKYLRSADYGDVYLDDAQHFNAVHLSGLRDRVVNGQDRELNYKPPGGLQTGPGGVILTRAERGLPLGPNADLAGIVRSSSRWSPTFGIGKIYRGDVGNLVVPSIGMNTQRDRYALGTDRVENWHDLVDLSLDHIYDMRDLRAGAKAQKGPLKHVYGIEGDLNHPGAQTGIAIANVHEWEPPHVSADAHRAEFHADPAVVALHRVFPRLLSWMKDEYGVRSVAALPKQTQVALNMGLIHAKQIKHNARR